MAVPITCVGPMRPSVARRSVVVSKGFCSHLALPWVAQGLAGWGSGAPPRYIHTHACPDERIRQTTLQGPGVSSTYVHDDTVTSAFFRKVLGVLLHCAWGLCVVLPSLRCIGFVVLTTLGAAGMVLDCLGGPVKAKCTIQNHPRYRQTGTSDRDPWA